MLTKICCGEYLHSRGRKEQDNGENDVRKSLNNFTL